MASRSFVAVVGMDPHCHLTGIVELRGEELDERERVRPLEELAVHLDEGLVDVRHDQVKADGFSVHFRENHEIGPDNILQFLDLVLEFIVGHGHEAPVLFPDLVVKLLKDLGILEQAFSCSKDGW